LVCGPLDRGRVTARVWQPRAICWQLLWLERTRDRHRADNETFAGVRPASPDGDVNGDVI